MTAILSLLSGGWKWLAAVGGIAAAIAASYFGGKKVGNVQTQAKADVETAKQETQQAEATAQAESDNAKVAKSVQQENASVTDDNARSRMQQSKYNSAD